MNQQLWFHVSTVHPMRHDLLTCKKDLHKYKALYYDARKEIAQLKNQIQKLSVNHAKVQSDLKAVHDKYKQWGKKRKCPFKECEIPNKSSRLENYKPFLDKIMDVVPHCKKLSIRIDEDGQPLELSLSKCADTTPPSSSNEEKKKGPDHNYCNKDKPETAEECPCAENAEDTEAGIYNSDGTFTKKHIRKAVMVTDNFRISNDAYHEIRSELSGHMPPVGRLKVEKAVMSEGIPYEKHPTVSDNFL